MAATSKPFVPSGLKSKEFVPSNQTQMALQVTFQGPQAKVQGGYYYQKPQLLVPPANPLRCPKTERTKYKTELCKNWIETGVCRYGDKCQFAHGYHELVYQGPKNQKYKSKQCNTFIERLYCPYGNRCLFKHEDRTEEEVTEFFYVLRLLAEPLSCIRNQIQNKE